MHPQDCADGIAQKSPPMTPELIGDALGELLAPYLSTNGPGFVVGVAWQGNTLLRRAYGLAHLELDVPLSPDHAFPICSITKQMSSLCALLLANEGVLDLDAAIGCYVPELPKIAQQPTLRQLMTHQSGLRCFVDTTALDPLSAPRPDRVGLVTLKDIDSVNAPPGARQVYCPSGHFLLSIAMERASGLPFPELCHRELFERLGLAHTHQADFPKSIVRNSPSHYEPAPKGGWKLVTQDRFETLGEGGFYSTVDDLLAWTTALRTQDTRVPAALWQALKTPPTLPNGQQSTYALGLQRMNWRGAELFGHGGGSPGIVTQMLASAAHELDIVVMANSDFPSGMIALKLFERIVGDANLGPAPEPVDVEAYPDLPGKIFVSPTFVAEFGRAGDKLTVAVLGNPPTPVLASEIETRDFWMPGLTTSIDFSVSSDRLMVRAYGEDHHCAELITYPLSARSIAADLTGTYEHAGLRSRFIVFEDGDRLAFEYLGRFGWAAGEIQPISREFMRLVWPPAAPYYFCLQVLRDAEGAVSGFNYSTSRTRALPFSKIP